MNEICEAYDLRIKNEAVRGTCAWIRNIYLKYSYYDQDLYKQRIVFEDYITSLSKENYSPKQHSIFCLISSNYTSISSLKELDIDLSLLDEEGIEELVEYYRLEKPTQRYNEIRASIAAPTSYHTRIPYRVIQELHKRGKVPFDRQIFAACLIRFNAWNATGYSSVIPEKAKQKFDTFFPQDESTLDLLMAVFEMELGVDGAYYIEAEFTISAIIIELVNRKILSRSTIQQKLFDAFNNPTLKQTTHGWAKNVYRDLTFTIEENLACQSQLIQLMYNDRNLLVNFGLQQLKKISNHKSFDWDLFIHSLDGVVYAEKLTGGLKTVSGILSKKLKNDATLIEQSCINLAPIFLQENNSVQMAAMECFKLVEIPNPAIKEALLPFIDTMHSEVKTGLSNLLGNEAAITSSYKSYEQVKYSPQHCHNENKIAYIDNEDDFIFLLSKVIKSPNALDYELFLEAILRYNHLKDTHAKTLKPALQQAKKIADEEYLNITNRVGIHHILASKLICCWLSPTPATIEMEIEDWKAKVKEESRFEYTANRFIAVYNQFNRISFISNQLQKTEFLPLLSTPTHGNFEIDPNLFLERLAKYHTAEYLPNEQDFCIALARINRWSTYDKKHLDTTTEYGVIIHYLLNEKEAFDPKKIKNLNSVWLTAYALKNPNKSIEALIADHKNQEWWTAKSSWNWEMIREYDDSGKYSWPTLHFNNDKTPTTENCYFEYLSTSSELIIADVSHWFSRNGFLHDPLYLAISVNVMRFADLEAQETKSTLEVIKYIAQNPMPLEKAGYLFLSFSLFCSNTSIRTASFDWLSILIENKYLDIDQFTEATSKIIIGEKHPTPLARVAEQFSRLLAMDGVYIDVLHQIIEKCFTRIDTTDLPKSFNKILHHYYEVLQIIELPIPKLIHHSLEEMKTVNSVKKEVKKY